MVSAAQDEFVESLKKNLIVSGKKNVILVEPGEKNRDKAMENIAEAFSDPVKEFIDKETSRRSDAKVAEITSYDKSVSISLSKDASTGREFTDLSVDKTVANSVSQHNQSSQSHPDIRGNITSVSDALYAHEANHDNPHHVKAHQVGAYTQQETDDRISDALSGEVGGWLGNLTVAEVNALTTHKKGDSATMLDAGTVMPGSVTVEIGDDIMWVDSLDVWQPKISDHLHHDETLVGTGSTADPLGVNPETIEDNVLRMRYRGGGRLKFWRTNPLPTT